MVVLTVGTGSRPWDTYSRNTCSSIPCVNSKPEHGKNSSADYSKVAEPVSVAGARGNGKRYVQVGANSTIENCRYSIAYSCYQSDEHGISGCEA
jgi:hypothetical protein